MPGATLGAGSAALRQRGYALHRFTRGGVKPDLLLDGTRDRAYVDGARIALNTAISTGASGVRTGFNVAGDLVDFPAATLRRVTDPVRGGGMRSGFSTQNLIDEYHDLSNWLANGLATASVSATQGLTHGTFYNQIDVGAVGSGQGANRLSKNTIVAADTQYTLSADVLDIDATWINFRVFTSTTDAILDVNLQTGGVQSISSVDSYSVATNPDGSWRVSLVFTTGAATTSANIRIGGPISQVSTGQLFLADNLQLEEGDHASSRIRSAGVVTSRPADALTVPLGPWFTPGQGTVLFTGVLLGASGSLDRLFQLGDSAADCLFLYYEAALSRLTYGVNVGSVWQGGGGAGAYSPGDPVACAVSWNGTQISVSLNGAVAQDFAVSAMPTLTDLNIGHGAGADDGTQLTQLLAIWPQVDADLQGLSAWAM
jgi:hypothetical protein